jgi:hypothetical protein
MLRRFFTLTRLLPSSVFARDISEVSVRDPNFQLVKTLTSADDLAAFNELWSSRTVQKSEIGVGPLYKINIQRGRRGDSWFYDPSGLLRLLTVHRTPVYGLAERDAFNRLLGIDAP